VSVKAFCSGGAMLSVKPEARVPAEKLPVELSAFFPLPHPVKTENNNKTAMKSPNALFIPIPDPPFIIR
jgi:hypothetical protein